MADVALTFTFSDIEEFMDFAFRLIRPTPTSDRPPPPTPTEFFQEQDVKRTLAHIEAERSELFGDPPF